MLSAPAGDPSGILRRRSRVKKQGDVILPMYGVANQSIIQSFNHIICS